MRVVPKCGEAIMVKKSGYNVYQGTHPIMVLPWFLYDCELLDNPYDYGGSSKLLEVRPRGNALEARALPTGFVTSVLSDLDVTDDEAIVAFCRTFGMVACPYARGFERMARRIESPMSDAEFYSARKFMSRDETDLRKPESGPMNWVRNRVLTMVSGLFCSLSKSCPNGCPNWAGTAGRFGLSS